MITENHQSDQINFRASKVVYLMITGQILSMAYKYMK